MRCRWALGTDEHAAQVVAGRSFLCVLAARVGRAQPVGQHDFQSQHVRCRVKPYLRQCARRGVLGQRCRRSCRPTGSTCPSRKLAVGRHELVTCVLMTPGSRRRGALAVDLQHAVEARQADDDAASPAALPPLSPGPTRARRRGRPLCGTGARRLHVPARRLARRRPSDDAEVRHPVAARRCAMLPGGRSGRGGRRSGGARG